MASLSIFRCLVLQRHLALCAVGLLTRTCLASYQIAGWHGHALLRGRAWSRGGQARSRNVA